MILHNTCNQIFSLSADFIWELENQIVCWGEISVIFRRLILRTWLSGGKFKSREENTCVQSFKTICTRQWRDFLNKHHWDIWCDCYFIYDQRKFDSVSLYYTIQEMHSDYSCFHIHHRRLCRSAVLCNRTCWTATNELQIYINDSVTP